MERCFRERKGGDGEKEGGEKTGISHGYETWSLK